jgi:excinuclease ABC subunit C
MTTAAELERQLKDSPDLPGVYLFRGPEGEVLYVGKAVSLRKRLTTYQQAVRGEGGRLPAKVLDMGRRAENVEWIVTSSEVEAFLLEHSLIKRHRPPFNIRLRDDKSYPYVVVMMEDEFPRIMFTRLPHRKGNLYFGPFASAAKVRETLDMLGKIFPYRKCRGPKPGRRTGSPCLQYHIKRCDAPCVGLVSREQYGLIVDQVVDFLQGKEREVADRIDASMKAAAGAMDFELAALFRDRLEAVNHVLERQRVRLPTAGNTDVIGMAVRDDGANIQVFLLREGLLTDRRSFIMENVEGEDEGDVFARFVGEYYSSAVAVPPEIIVPSSIVGLEALSDFLEELRHTNVDVRHAERGDKRRLQELATRNAVLALEHERLRAERSRERRYGALVGLQQLLGLDHPPLRIEGYDISNLGPEHLVASMVVFEGGAPRKSDYRKFAIAGVEGQDDFASMREALTRRFTRAEGGLTDAAAYDPSFESVPDLVLVDGGKGQLGVALSVLEETGLDQVVSLLSLAKREEEVYLPGRSEPVRLERDDPSLLLLQRVRDEAHRFAVAYHRTRRRSGATASMLDELPGVGEKRKQAILQHFGSPDRFLEASREELEAVPGLPGKVARDIYDFVHKTG